MIDLFFPLLTCYPHIFTGLGELKVVISFFSIKVWISQPGSGLEKRQCTLKICFSPTGKQPKLAIVFRGTGKRISEDEKQSWHKDVDVYFQVFIYQLDTSFIFVVKSIVFYT